MVLYAIEDKQGGGIDGKIELVEQVCNIAECDGSTQIRKFGPAGYGRQASREFPYFFSIVVFDNVAAASGNGNCVEQLEEIIAKLIYQPFCCYFF